MPSSVKHHVLEPSEAERGSAAAEYWEALMGDSPALMSSLTSVPGQNKLVMRVLHTSVSRWGGGTETLPTGRDVSMLRANSGRAEADGRKPLTTCSSIQEAFHSSVFRSPWWRGGISFCMGRCARCATFFFFFRAMRYLGCTQGLVLKWSLVGNDYKRGTQR